MKPQHNTKPALWTKVPGAKPVVSADRAEFSHGPRLTGKRWGLARTANAIPFWAVGPHLPLDPEYKAVLDYLRDHPDAKVVRKGKWAHVYLNGNIVNLLANKRRLKAVSTARAKQLRQYSNLKREWLLRNRYCRVCGRRDVGSVKIDLHHSHGRSGTLLCMTEFWIPLCRVHHDRVKTDPAWAYANGLLAPKGAYNSVPR